IPAVAAFIGYGLIGYSVFGHHIGSISFGIRQAIVQYITMLGGIYLAAFVIDALAKNFGATKNFNQAFSLVAYSYTPMFIGGIFNIYHSLTWLAMVAGIYGLYLLYIGLKPMMKVPDEKQTSYFVVSLLVMILAMFIIMGILGAFLLRGMMPHF
ncbi:MAG: YIP1 family protein, partial [Firmicutes bacterium]|nr:YIP1 family protein [Bacillota bacterium]